MPLMDLVRLREAAYSARPPKIESLKPGELPLLPEMRPLGTFFPISCLELYVSPLLESMNATWCEYFTQMLRQLVYQVTNFHTIWTVYYNLLALNSNH